VAIYTRTRVARLRIPIATAGALAALLLVDCNAAETSGFTASGSTATVTAAEITFSYPADWSRTAWDSRGSFTYMVAAVSNRTLKSPCVVSLMYSSCGAPVATLEPATLLVEWWEDGFPAWKLADQPGVALELDGLDAKVQDPADMSQVCQHIGADSAIQVLIDRGSANYFAFQACFKGPGIEAESSEAQAILHSAHFKR